MDCGTARGLPIVGNPEERTDGGRRGELHNHAEAPSTGRGAQARATARLGEPSAADRGGEADAGDHYVDIDGTAYAPEGRVSRAEFERARLAELAGLKAEIELLCEGIEVLKRGARSRIQSP